MASETVEYYETEISFGKATAEALKHLETNPRVVCTFSKKPTFVVITPRVGKERTPTHSKEVKKSLKTYVEHKDYWLKTPEKKTSSRETRVEKLLENKDYILVFPEAEKIEDRWKAVEELYKNQPLQDSAHEDSIDVDEQDRSGTSSRMSTVADASTSFSSSSSYQKESLCYSLRSLMSLVPEEKFEDFKAAFDALLPFMKKMFT